MRISKVKSEREADKDMLYLQDAIALESIDGVNYAKRFEPGDSCAKQCIRI